MWGEIIKSERINWIREFFKFTAIMITFTSLDSSGWDIGIPNLVPPLSWSPTPFMLLTSLTGYSLTMAYRIQEDGKDIERNAELNWGKRL